MTEAEQKEYDYRVQERLGMLCGAGEPTAEQQAIAESEAFVAIRLLRLADRPVRRFPVKPA